MAAALNLKPNMGLNQKKFLLSIKTKYHHLRQILMLAKATHKESKIILSNTENIFVNKY
jgi:hypothetical protein